MKEKMMMGLEGVGIGLSLIILALRLYVGHLKSWRPYRIELFGVVTFSLAVVFAMYIFIHYTVDGVRIGRWRANGDDDDMISAKLLTDTDFKVCPAVGPAGGVLHRHTDFRGGRIVYLYHESGGGVKSLVREGKLFV
jgi:hypothetical protein